MTAYVMGIDISTTGAKALIVDADGSVVASHNTPQTLSQPKPLWSEQNPADWWDGIQAAIRGALDAADLTGDAIDAIGLTGQMHGLVILDGAGGVLRPSILWNDQRTQAQCDMMTETVGFERLIQLTGNRALTGFTAPKLLWVRDEEPDVYAKIAQVLLPKDYIRYKLTGEYATDLAGAAGTSLLNVAERQWSSDVLDALDIPAEWMPPTHEGTAITGTVSQQAADATGLAAGTPVVAGGGDQGAGAVGVGAVQAHIASLVVGTSGVVFLPLDTYAYDAQGRVHAFCHAVPDMWHFMGVMLSAAGSLQWYRDTIAPDMPFANLLDEIQEIPAGSEGLFFLPYLTGERTPHPDPLARGAFIGLTARHTRAHLTRAVLEGVAFGLRDGFALMREAATLPDNLEVRISGGGAQSPIWQQILADVLDTALLNVNTTEGAAFGAALLASVGAKHYDDVPTACAATIQTGDTVTPTKERAVYDDLYTTYTSLYPTLKETMHALHSES